MVVKGNNDSKELVRRLKRGKSSAFDEIFHQYSRRVYRFAYSYLKNHQDAEGITQEVFLRVWKNRGSIDGHYSFKAYLFTISYNIMMDKFRDRAKEKEYLEFLKEQAGKLDNDTEKQVAYSELNESYQKAIKLLPERRKAIYLLYNVNGLSYKEIAKELQISYKTVENQMSQAHKYIRDKLGPGTIVSLLFYHLFV